MFDFRRAHIPCVIIHGLTKNITYDAGAKVTGTKNKGTWNAVHVDGNWRLVHPLWGSRAAPGYATGRWGLVTDSTLVPDNNDPWTTESAPITNEFYFLTDPAKFVTKCFPDHQVWQLLESPISRPEFEDMPFFQPAYYDLKLEEENHQSCVVHTENGVCELVFAFPPEREKRYSFSFKLHARREHDVEGEYDLQPLHRYCYSYRFENKQYFHFRFPYNGVFKLDIYCKNDKRALLSDWVAEYKIICTDTNANVKPLPITPKIGWGPTDALDTHGMSCLTHKNALVSLDGDDATFIRFGLPKDKNVRIEADLVTLGMSRDAMKDHVTVEVDGETAAVQVAPPGEGEYALQVYVIDDGHRTNVCNFLMTRTKIVEVCLQCGYLCNCIT